VPVARIFFYLACEAISFLKHIKYTFDLPGHKKQSSVNRLTQRNVYGWLDREISPWTYTTTTVTDNAFSPRWRIILGIKHVNPNRVEVTTSVYTAHMTPMSMVQRNTTYDTAQHYTPHTNISNLGGECTRKWENDEAFTGWFTFFYFDWVSERDVVSDNWLRLKRNRIFCRLNHVNCFQVSYLMPAENIRCFGQLSLSPAVGLWNVGFESGRNPIFLSFNCPI